MQTVRDFVIAIPHLCGAKNAERIARRNELVYADEVANKEGVFSRNDLDAEDPFNRGDILFGFDGDEKKIAQCRRLFRIAELSHYKSEHSELYSSKDAVELDALIVEAVCAESDNQDIAAVFTVDSATSVAGW